jgi:hypothetical protein
MNNNFDNLFLIQNAIADSSAVVVRRRRPVEIMELFG